MGTLVGAFVDDGAFVDEGAFVDVEGGFGTIEQNPGLLWTLFSHIVSTIHSA